MQGLKLNGFIYITMWTNWFPRMNQSISNATWCLIIISALSALNYVCNLI